MGKNLVNFLTFFRKSFLLLFLAFLFSMGVLFLPFLSKKTSQGEKNILNVVVVPPVQALSITATFSAKPKVESEVKIITTLKGDDLQVLINKQIRLPAAYEPKDLVFISDVPSVRTGMLLRSGAYEALKEMDSEAKTAGVGLIVLSSYRSYWEQQNTFSSWVASAGLAAAQNFSARPGHSQHQLGTTIDFTSNEINKSLGETFEKTKEGLWLASNAYRYGYVIAYPKGKEAITGYTYEPWHYRYIGKENAQKMIDSGLILEEYLRKFGVW